MHIAVFGATTKVGKAVVVKLVEQNHTVTAFEHDGNPFASHPHIRIVQGDIHNPSDITRALEGVEAVVTTIGTWQTGTAFAPAMRNILTEMEQREIWRIVSLTSAVTRIEGDHSGSVQRWVYKLYKTLMPKILRDYEDQIRFLQSSKADWTIIRVPSLSTGGKKGSWKFSLDPPYPWQHVHVDDVADALVRQLSEDRYLSQAPYIRGK